MAIEDIKDENVSSVEPASTITSEHPAENVESNVEVAADTKDTTEVRNDDVSKGAGITEVKKVPTELERAQYSFHKQFAKQNRKHAEELAEMKKLVESLQDQIKNPDKYRPKYRDDFNTADEYIDYRSEQKFNKLMEEQRAKMEQEAKEKSEYDAMTNYYRERAQKHINTLYPTDEAKAHYKEVVDKAFNDGLGELLDKDENVSNYLMRRPYGPAILMAIAEEPETYLSRLYDDPYMNTRERLDELKDIEREVINKLEQAKKQAEIASQQHTATPAEPPKVVGKPGINATAKRNIWDDDKALDSFLDARR